MTRLLWSNHALVTQGTFTFAISPLRKGRPALRLLRHIDLYRGRKLSLNLTLLLYQIFFDFSNERFLRVSNATIRTELVSYFLSR